VATIYARGDTYYLNWREAGTQFRRSLGKIGRKEAEAIRVQKEAELSGLIAPRAGRTVGHVLQDYLDWSQAARPDSYKGTKYALLPLIAAFGPHPAEGLNPDLVDRWSNDQPKAAATIAKSLKMARAAYRRAIRLQQVRANPFESATMPKVIVSRAPPWFTHDELADLFKAQRGPLWRFMVNTGVRRGEIAKARRDDVRNGMLHIESTETGRTKSGRWRWVPLNDAALDALASLGEDRLVDCHPDTITDWFGEDREAVNVEREKARKRPLKGSPHWLRHTFCTHLAQAGVSLHEIQRLAGHSSVAVTEKYAHHLPDAGRSAIDRLKL
jgi:integrase